MNPAIALTGSRLIFGPLFALFFITAAAKGIYTPDKAFFWLSVLTVVLIELSDAFDGIVARARNEVTSFGKIFDPICDSLSRQTIFLSFMIVGIIPMWMFLIYLYRDGLMSFIRVMAASSGNVLAARPSGKLKAIFQAIGTFLVLGIIGAHIYIPESVPKTLWCKHPGFWIMIFPTLFTFISIFDYLIPNWNILADAAKPSVEETKKDN